MFILHLFTRSPFDCSLNNECSCPPRKWVLEPSKRWVLEPSKIMGARPHFFKRASHELICFHVHFAFAHLFSVWLFFKQWVLVPLWMVSARALLENDYSSPQKDGCSAPSKIMGACPHFFRRAFQELYSFMSILHLLNCSLFGYSSNNECLCPFWMMSARALLKNGCSASTPKIMGARRALLK